MRKGERHSKGCIREQVTTGVGAVGGESDWGPFEKLRGAHLRMVLLRGEGTGGLTPLPPCTGEGCSWGISSPALPSHPDSCPQALKARDCSPAQGPELSACAVKGGQWPVEDLARSWQPPWPHLPVRITSQWFSLHSCFPYSTILTHMPKKRKNWQKRHQTVVTDRGYFPGRYVGGNCCRY